MREDDEPELVPEILQFVNLHECSGAINIVDPGNHVGIVILVLLQEHAGVRMTETDLEG